MKKFIETVPIKYAGSLGFIGTQDYFAIAPNIMSEIGYKSIIISNEDFQVYSIKEHKSNLKPSVEILNRTSMFKYLKYIIKNKNAVWFCNDRTLRSFIPGLFVKKAVFMSHQSSLPNKWWKIQVFKFFVKRFSAIKVSNPYEKDELIKIGVNKDKIHYIPLVIDQDFFSKTISSTKKTSLRKKYGIKNDEKVLLFLGFIRKFKNPYSVLNAVKILKQKGLKFKLLIVGVDGLLEENGPTMREFAKKLDILDCIIFTGPRKSEQIREIFQIVDVGINSSYHEGQCIVVYEMASAKIPLCLSAIGSFTSVFKDSALFHESEDYETLAKNIETYLSNSSLSKKHVAKNVEIVKTCSYLNVKKNLLKLFTGFAK